jgi:hypothetical protein
MWATYVCNFHKTILNKQSPKGRKFAKSGHPVLVQRFLVRSVFALSGCGFFRYLPRRRNKRRSNSTYTVIAKNVLSKISL